MAITKERLQELINEGATIYTIKHIGGDVMELHLKNISDDFRYFLLDMTEELFEDKAEVDRSDRKILKKAMEIITEIRDAKPDPITLETIRLGRELDQEYYERIKDKDTEDGDMFE